MFFLLFHKETLYNPITESLVKIRKLDPMFIQLNLSYWEHYWKR